MTHAGWCGCRGNVPLSCPVTSASSLLDGEWVGRSCGKQKERGNKKQVGGGLRCIQRGSEKDDVIDLTGSGETASERRCGGGLKKPCRAAASTSYSAVPGWRRDGVSILMLHHAAMRESMEVGGALITPVCL